MRLDNLGSTKAADARGDRGVVERIAKATGLTPGAVRARLRRHHGSTLVRNVFDDRWPARLDELGSRRASELVLDPGAVVELARLLNRSERVALAALVKYPRRSTRSALREHWPAISRLSRDAILRRTIKDLRSLARAEEVARALEIDVRACRRRLAHADGRTSVARAFADLLVPTPAASRRSSLLAGRYECLGRAHRGGMGDVREALDHGVDPPQLVVLKWARPGDHGLAKALVDEFRRSRGVVHPHLVKYLGRGIDEAGRPFLVVEHAGESLHDRLLREPLAWAQALTVLRSVADAIDYLRDERRLAHLDVTPRNILIDKAGTTRLIDFGVTRGIDSHAQLTSTVEYGNRIYQAPEVHRRHGLHADQYSLAMVALAIERGPDRLVELMLEHEAQALATGAGLAPIRRALQRDPRKRFESATAFVDALAESIESPGGFGKWLAGLLG